MGRSYTPKHAFILREVTGRLTSPMAWRGPINLKTARKFLIAYNKSLKPGGVNAHLGRAAHATGIIIYNQKTRDDVLTYPSMRHGSHGNLLKNPPTKNQRRAVRLAQKLAYRIWQHVRSKGYALPIPKRTPKLVKKYVRVILKANRINWKIKNPPKIKYLKCPICSRKTPWVGKIPKRKFLKCRLCRAESPAKFWKE